MILMSGGGDGAMVRFDFPAQEVKEHVMTMPINSVRLIALLAFGFSSVRAEIISVADLPSQKQYLAKLAEFDQRGCLDIYKKTGKHDPKWDADAVQYLIDAINRPSPQKDHEPLSAMEHRGSEILAKGCDDGLVRYHYGKVQLDLGDRGGAEQSFRAACTALPAQGYPPNILARAASEVCTLMTMQGRKDEADKFANIVASAAAEEFKTHLFSKNGQRDLLMGELAETGRYLDNTQHETIWKAAAAVSDADPVAVLFLEGEFRTKQAWHFRGGGFANTVTPEGWQGFEAELKKAKDCYTKAWEMDKTLPQAPAAMIAIAMGSAGVDEMRTWFDRAVARDSIIPMPITRSSGGSIQDGTALEKC